MKRSMKKLIGLCAVAAVLLFVVARVRANDSLLPVGAAAPEVVGKDAAGTSFKLSAAEGALRGRLLLSQGRDGRLHQGGLRVSRRLRQVRQGGRHHLRGLARQDEASHKGFREHYHLPFPMVADTSGAVQRAYGVPSVMPGVDIAARVTFLVGPDGKIARVWPKVDPVVNAKEVLDAVAALGGKKP